MNILINVLLGLDLLVALLMIFVILMQRPKSEGLGAAFGGGVTENIFGAQTTNVLTRFTSWLAGIFFILTFVLSILYAQRSMGGSNLRRELLRAQSAAVAQPAASPLPSVAGSAASVTSPAPAGASPSPVATVKPADMAVGAVPAPPLGSPAASMPTATATAPLPHSP